ncbi:MAG: hypothetical protein AB7J46_06385 [Candidatus Altimarinota bacterium]
MATYNKFEVFVGDLAGGVHDILGTGGSGADTLKVYLSNTAPDASADSVIGDLAEIASGSGYTSGGYSVTNVGTRSGGTFTLQGTSLAITAIGGSVGPFRYVVLYNDTSASDSLIAWWDYGSSLTLDDGESIVIKFNSAALGAAGNILTIV